MEGKVSVKDYEEQKHYLLCALNLVGVKTDYITTDLIYVTIEKLKEKGGIFDLKDAVKIKIEHERKWEDYFENQNDEEIKE
jgi:hypothetical protein